MKLLYTCLDAGPAALGLPKGTLPVFLRLRRLRRDDLALSFGALIERQLHELAGKDLPRGLGERLWRRGKLLLLLDGLDELADDALRAEVCRALEWQLAMHGGRGIRALVSCRFTGYGGKVRLSDAFLHLEVRPLSAVQCRQLVHAWFQEAQHAIPGYGEEEARRAAQGLADTLDSSAYASQRLKVLVSSPLLLTLLCVVVLRGGEMPKQRVAFYEQCLRVLLGKWTKIAREREPLLDVDAALAVLRPLAYKLHVEERQDDLSRIELFRELRAALQGLEKKASPHDVLDWLHRETGLLEEYAPQHFGFMHLGLQEYLSALHIAKQGTALLPDLAVKAPQRWWREVAMLLVGLPGHAVFAPFLEALLVGDAVLEHADLLRDLLDEAEEVELEPFLAQLAPTVAVERQAAVLRLLLHRRDPRLVERAAVLSSSPDADVAALADQIVEGARGRGRVGSRSFELFLAHHESDREAATELAKRLRRHNLVLYEIPADESWQDHLQPILEQTRSVALLAGPCCGRPWEDRDLGILAEEAVLAGRTVLPVLLPGVVEAAELSEIFAGASWIDFRQEVRVAAFNEARAARLRQATAVEVYEEEVALSVAAEEVDGGNVVPGESFVDKTTGIRFLWVPGGRFQMGGDVYDDEKPIHWVRLSPFWIGETPVTNEQYGVFLEATGHQEPGLWRDRRFSEPGQPVVGVSWEDAREYGRWLAKVSALRVHLPSEAQWEMAARGTDGREYPWGDAEPSSRLACFGLDWETDKPATVGSFPDGVGPHGTLDQAGLVWEWCLDVWDEEVYAKRSRDEEPLDPVVTVGDEPNHSIRGGGWDYPAVNIRAACRDRHWAWDNVLGFRLVVAPSSR